MDTKIKGTTGNSLHVCMLVYSFYESDNRVMRYAETLAGRGDRVDVIALRGDDQPYCDELRGVKITRIQHRLKNEQGQLAYAYRILKFMLKAAFLISRIHLRDPYDLIHVHNMPDFLVFSAFYPKMKGTRVLLDIHDIVPELYATMFSRGQRSIFFRLMLFLEKASVKFADHVIVANHIWHKTIISRSACDSGCSVVLNYPDEKVFFRRVGVKCDGKFVMVYPGSLSRRQGVDIAIRAVSLIRDDLPQAELHIYGDGTARGYLEALVQELGLSDRVFFKGSLPIYDVAEKMAGADLGVEPKRNDLFAGDAMSTKILEFMSLGVPVVASDTRVHKYYFNGQVLKFFRNEDERDLADAILEIAQDDYYRKHLAETGAIFAADYSWAKKKIKYLTLLDQLVDSQPGNS